MSITKEQQKKFEHKRRNDVTKSSSKNRKICADRTKLALIERMKSCGYNRETRKEKRKRDSDEEEKKVEKNNRKRHRMTKESNRSLGLASKKR